MVVLSGDLDRYSAMTLQVQLEKVWQSGSELVILDLRGVEFIDSSGVQSLVLASRRAQQAGMRLGVVAIDERIDERLWRYGLSRVLDVAAAPEELLGRPDREAASQPDSADQEPV